MPLLAELLSSRVREKVFECLFDGKGAELHIRELERRSGFTIGAIQTELKKLSRLDLVVSRRDGNRLYYRANLEHPLYPDIRGMVEKTVGLFGKLGDALSSLQKVDCAFVFGSMAGGAGTASSDVDLMVIGDIGLRALSSRLAGLSVLIGREINPHVLSAAEFKRRAGEKEHFVEAVLVSPRVFVRGGESELGKLMASQEVINAPRVGRPDQ